jgi:hypothetical protein
VSLAGLLALGRGIVAEVCIVLLDEVQAGLAVFERFALDRVEAHDGMLLVRCLPPRAERVIAAYGRCLSAAGWRFDEGLKAFVLSQAGRAPAVRK